MLRLIPGYDPFSQADGCWFDVKAAELAIEFFPDLLVHVEGDLAGKPFKLEPWQQSIVANLFGWKRKDEAGREVRRFREAYIEVPRKNGKTPLCAGIALLVLFTDGEKNQQDYVAAGDRLQAGMLFRHAKGMVERNEFLKDRCRIYGGTAAAGQSKSLVKPDGSFLQIISADADTKHGGNTHLAIVDELHVQPDRELMDVLQTSMASANRKQPLLIEITTAGHDRQSICFEKYSYACKVRDNGGDRERPGYDPSFLPVIYEALPADDWTAEATWRKSNPNLGISVSLEYLQRECKRAKEIPDYENTFKQLHLNLWTEQATRWLSMAAWEKCGQTRVDISQIGGRECFGGLDLASSEDTTALVLLFPEDDGSVTLLSRFWVPEAKVRKRAAAREAPYEVWANNGWLTVTDGDWCDYTVVEEDIKRLSATYVIKELAYDPAEANMLAQRLLESGLTMMAFTQSCVNYNEPVKHFEQLVCEGKVRHGNNPVLSWMAGNVALHRNAAGLRRPSKASSGDKIDGIAATLMALAVSMRSPVPTGGGVEFW